MQNIFYKKQKGSTLLLAMVIISTVLFAGIGVATILSRQIKEIPSIKDEATAFYINETLVDMIKKVGIEDANCDNLDFENVDVECSAEEINEKYYTKIRINNNYYRFITDKSESGGGGEADEDFVKIYFQNPGWANPKVQYMLGTTTRIYKNAEVSSYSGWVVSTISKEELSGDSWVAIRICPGTDDLGCKDTTGWKQIEKIKTPICRFSCSGNDCNIPCINPDTILVYFKKPTGWGEIITSSFRDTLSKYINKIMNESLNVGWMQSEVNLSGIEISNRWRIIYFCEGEKGEGESCGGTGFPSGWMRWGIICVDGLTSSNCFSPDNNY